MVLWFLLGLGLTPGNLGRRDPLAGGGGAPTCIPKYTWLTDEETVDHRPQAAVDVGRYVGVFLLLLY